MPDPVAAVVAPAVAAPAAAPVVAPVAPAVAPAVAAPVTTEAPAPAVAPVVAPAAPAAPAAGATIPVAENVLTDPPVEPPPAEVVPEAVAPITVESYELSEPLTTAGITKADPLILSALTKAAELGLPTAQVNGLLEATVPQIIEALVQPHKAWVDMQNTWSAEIKADLELGGAKLDASVRSIRRGLDAFAQSMGGEPAVVADRRAQLDQALKITGAGNNPMIFRALHFLSSHFAEGAPVVGGPTGSNGAPPKSAGALLFDHPTSTAAAQNAART